MGDKYIILPTNTSDLNVIKKVLDYLYKNIEIHYNKEEFQKETQYTSAESHKIAFLDYFSLIERNDKNIRFTLTAQFVYLYWNNVEVRNKLLILSWLCSSIPSNWNSINKPAGKHYIICKLFKIIIENKDLDLSIIIEKLKKFISDEDNLTKNSEPDKMIDKSDKIIGYFKGILNNLNILNMHEKKWNLDLLNEVNKWINILEQNNFEIDTLKEIIITIIQSQSLNLEKSNLNLYDNFENWLSTIYKTYKNEILSEKSISSYLNSLKKNIPNLLSKFLNKEIYIFEIYDSTIINDYIKIFENELKDEDYNRLYSNSLKRYSEFLDYYSINSTSQKRSSLPYQKIVYGAPGTGKSYSLNQQAEKHFGNNIKRVTFYDGYTYGQFVGMYKPTLMKDNDIGYSYVPGPFMQQLVQSLKNPKNNFCLVVEEINRAKADKVFGNIFQLLDRNSSGKSRYPVSISEEQLKFLQIELKEQEEILREIEEKGLYIPNNLYVWATMNSADEGVQPLDTAFKRRWKFEYISLNKNEKEFEKQRENIKLIIGKNKTSNLEWNEFRKTVNGKLQEYNITEDRLIAPFFISPDDFTILVSEGMYALDKNIFVEKVLMYIFDDLLRHYPKIRNEIFKGNIKTFSNIYEALSNDKSELDNYYEKLNTILSENLFPGLFKEEENVSEK